jgi:hypothetical protein
MFGSSAGTAPFAAFSGYNVGYWLNCAAPASSRSPSTPPPGSGSYAASDPGGYWRRRGDGMTPWLLDYFDFFRRRTGTVSVTVVFGRRFASRLGTKRPVPASRVTFLGMVTSFLRLATRPSRSAGRCPDAPVAVVVWPIALRLGQRVVPAPMLWPDLVQPA